MAKVKIGMKGLTVPEQIERARLIVTNMTGNADYTTPSPALTVISTAADALETAYNESRNRDKVKVALMRMRRKELLYVINQLGAYVQQASGGDEEKIFSSGLILIIAFCLKLTNPETNQLVETIDSGKSHRRDP